MSARDRRDLDGGAGEVGGGGEVGPAPGKRTRTESLGGRGGEAARALPGLGLASEAAVQRQAAPRPGGGSFVDELLADDVTPHAEAGVAGAGDALPHLDRIQASFGRHDVSGIGAHVGGAAAEHAAALGAEAYATGDQVAFARAPDLFTAAHEAAHVVQQRGGVALLGGLDGGHHDPYEQHADQVAATVVRGASAEPLLDRMAGTGGGGPAVQRTVSIQDLDKKKKAAGPGALVSTDAMGASHEHAVRFGGLVNGCGSAMEAWLYPDDDIAGTAPSVRPSWWAAMNADPATDASWVSNYLVQGHLLNEHLGGPGDDMRNLTPFAKSTNSQHHAYVEKAAKAIKARGNIMRYTVVVDYSASPPAAWFGNKIAPAYLAHFAHKITCVLQEYDATTRTPIGSEVTTTVTNAMTGQG